METVNILLAGIVVIAIITILILVALMSKISTYLKIDGPGMSTADWNAVPTGGTESPADLKKSIRSYIMAAGFFATVSGILTTALSHIMLHNYGFTLFVTGVTVLVAITFLVMAHYSGQLTKDVSVADPTDEDIFLDKAAYDMYYLVSFITILTSIVMVASSVLTWSYGRKAKKAASSLSEGLTAAPAVTSSPPVNGNGKFNWYQSAASAVAPTR
jgi:hypothetical protein